MNNVDGLFQNLECSRVYRYCQKKPLKSGTRLKTLSPNSGNVKIRIDLNLDEKLAKLQLFAALRSVGQHHPISE